MEQDVEELINLIKYEISLVSAIDDGDIGYINGLERSLDIIKEWNNSKEGINIRVLWNSEKK